MSIVELEKPGGTITFSNPASTLLESNSFVMDLEIGAYNIDLESDGNEETEDQVVDLPIVPGCEIISHCELTSSAFLEKRSAFALVVEELSELKCIEVFQGSTGSKMEYSLYPVLDLKNIIKQNFGLKVELSNLEIGEHLESHQDGIRSSDYSTEILRLHEFAMGYPITVVCKAFNSTEEKVSRCFYNPTLLSNTQQALLFKTIWEALPKTKVPILEKVSNELQLTSFSKTNKELRNAYLEDLDGKDNSDKIRKRRNTHYAKRQLLIESRQNDAKPSSKSSYSDQQISFERYQLARLDAIARGVVLP